MRFAVEPSPKGGYQVVSETVAMPVSHHDTEEEALERAAAYDAASEALGALDAETGEGVAVARYFRDRGRPDAAKAAVTVADASQGRGLGSAMLRRLVERAREEGIQRFTATLFTENRDMLHLFQRVGEVRTVAGDGSTHEIEVELPLEREALGSAMRAAAEGDARVDPRKPGS